MEQKSDPKFPAFPFKPYSIQNDFMNALYHSLDKGGIAMLESPTGTGKTLSIICSALQWLVDRKRRQDAETTADPSENQDRLGSDDEPDWLRNFVVSKDSEGPEKKVAEKKKCGFRSKKRDKTRNEGNFKDLVNRSGEEEDPYKNVEKNLKVKRNDEELEDKEFLMEEYESEEEGSGQSKRKAGRVSISSSSDDGEGDALSDEEERARLKIYFCSRTHSQLSQFVKELRKTMFASELRVVSLGSRKNLCINEEVLKLGNSSRINEQCLELQKNKKTEVSKMKNLGAGGRVRRAKAYCGCPMLRKHKLQKQFNKEMTNQEPLDIEDLVQLGVKLGTCPYYASRSMIPAADLVVLPYQSLLSKSSRESIGLDLKNNIVIIDEAHNLADSLIRMYDSKITSPQLKHVHTNLERYFQRFRNLLGPGNRRYIQTLMVLTRAFLQTLSNSPCSEEVYGAKSSTDASMDINEFLFSLNVDNINIVKVLQYMKESNIIHKVTKDMVSQVNGYQSKINSLQKGSALVDDGESGEERSTISSFRALADMLLSLTNNNGDGRIIVSRTGSTCSDCQGGYLKYIMLTGEKIFSEIVDQAHAVVLAGGTLQPIEETKERLFPWLQLDQLHLFSCGHIVPSENILPVAVSQGPSGQSFDFSYSSRSLSVMVEELGLLLCNLVTVVPEGIVVFFSSFDYEGHVHDSWKASGILERIMKKKHVFREPKRSTDVEVVLGKYKETIDALSRGCLVDDSPPHKGAILLAVVGGKVSEGINFSDGMGRCIVMVGLPYPSPSDIELMERVKHIEGLGDTTSFKAPKLVNNQSYKGDAQAGFDILRSCKQRGREYYENLCMKAVNQSIGRAIRHVNDYAAILLVDRRYAYDSSKRTSSHPTNKLPMWIRGPLVSTDNYGQVHRLLHQFFKVKKNRERSKPSNKAPMLLKTFHKTKNYFHKALQNLKSYALERYQKLSRPRFFNPFSSSSNPPKIQQLESFYTNFSEKWEPNPDVGTQRNKKSTMSAKEPTRKEKASNGHNMNYAEHHVTQNAKEERGWEESKLGSHREVKRGNSRSQSGHKRGGHVLEKKMKELEMMDVHDMAHVLDIEEVLHLYSHLTSPVYLDLVD
ncbi:hypothetical protein RJ639_037802, partial [Escallonia herrerae]